MPSHAASARRVGPRPAIRWDRLGRLALLVVLGVVVLLYVAPVSHYISQRKTAAAHQQELRGLENENRALTARARRLRRPGALEAEARRLGMVRPDERPFSIENIPSR